MGLIFLKKTTRLLQLILIDMTGYWGTIWGTAQAGDRECIVPTRWFHSKHRKTNHEYSKENTSKQVDFEIWKHQMARKTSQYNWLWNFSLGLHKDEGAWKSSLHNYRLKNWIIKEVGTNSNVLQWVVLNLGEGQYFNCERGP